MFPAKLRQDFLKMTFVSIRREVFVLCAYRLLLLALLLARLPASPVVFREG